MKCFICHCDVEPPADYVDLTDELICEDCEEDHAGIIALAKEMNSPPSVH